MLQLLFMQLTSQVLFCVHLTMVFIAWVATMHFDAEHSTCTVFCVEASSLNSQLAPPVHLTGETSGAVPSSCPSQPSQ
jgi:hypothetical protein